MTSIEDARLVRLYHVDSDSVAPVTAFSEQLGFICKGEPSIRQMKAIAVLVATLARASNDYLASEVQNQDHTKFDYFIARDPTERGDMDAVARELRLNYVGRVAHLNYRLFRKLKARGKTIEEILATARANGFLKRHGIEDFRSDVPHEIEYFSLPDPTNAGFKKQWFLVSHRLSTNRAAKRWRR